MSNSRPLSSPGRNPPHDVGRRPIERQGRGGPGPLGPAVVSAQVGKLLPDQPPQPADQRGLVLPGELRKLPDDLDEHFLDHVGHLDALAQPRTQARPDDHS